MTYKGFHLLILKLLQVLIYLLSDSDHHKIPPQSTMLNAIIDEIS